MPVEAWVVTLGDEPEGDLALRVGVAERRALQRDEIDGEIMAEFRSNATQKNGEITVKVIEYYRTNHVPLEHFEAYRSVINAAADFNKRTLVLSRL